jgi:hypothetical protein
VNAAADQQRLMPDTTANTWLLTKEHDELPGDERTKATGKEKQENRVVQPAAPAAALQNCAAKRKTTARFAP